MFDPTGSPLGIVKELVEIAKNVVEGIAVLAAGLWAYLRFVSNREDETAFEITYEYRTEQYKGNDYLLAIEIGFVNKGKVRLTAKRKSNPAFQTDDETLRFSGDLLVRAIDPDCMAPTTVDWFPTAKSRSPMPHDIEIDLLDEFMDNQETDFWLEPGETGHVGKVLILGPGHYLAMATFIGDRDDHEFWRRVFYIQVPGMIGSGKCTAPLKFGQVV